MSSRIRLNGYSLEKVRLLAMSGEKEVARERNVDGERNNNNVG